MLYLKVNIEAERVRKQLSKENLSQKLNVSLKTYYNWISESTDIPSSKLLEMARLFRVTMEYLMVSVSEDEKGA
ncbi:helix-turn-helix domain-containing protein [Hungatella hathewayi]|uniref:helix-turn-helix domain-containing protein n=1 Tax=Hungatella hathewayi TaxID=154046 RepID=UPI0009C15C67